MDRIVIVTKPTRLDELILQYHNLGTAKFVIESCGEAITPYEREHDAYNTSLEILRKQIPSDIPTVSVTRKDLPNFLFRPNDLIIVCGPDGLFANLAKYINNQHVLTVNPDPMTVSGELMLFLPDQVGGIVEKARDGKEEIERIPFVKADIGDKVIWGINDIFIGRNDQISARYKIGFDNLEERQSSSGIIVSTGIGSTGWISSIKTMFENLSYISGINRSNFVLNNLPKPTNSELVFVVREAFPSINTGTELCFGKINTKTPLTVVSEMPKGGCIFSDGVTEKSVEWNAGSKAVITVGDRYLKRIIN